MMKLVPADDKTISVALSSEPIPSTVTSLLVNPGHCLSLSSLPDGTARSGDPRSSLYTSSASSHFTMVIGRRPEANVVNLREKICNQPKKLNF